MSVSFSIAGVIAVSLLVLAFAAAPRSCEGGLSLYFWSGIVALAIFAALPFPTRMGKTIAPRIGWSLGFVAFGALVWLAGLFTANFRLLCRLF